MRLFHIPYSLVFSILIEQTLFAQQPRAYSLVPTPYSLLLVVQFAEEDFGFED